MDEWDAVFHMPFISDWDKKDYLLFLKSLLKGKIYVELAYMTGVLPIAKYSSGSELNMFVEYDDVRDDLIWMVAGERIEIKLQGYAATSTELNTRNQIYSAMVVYGLLTYEEGEVFIPNKERMDKFNELLSIPGFYNNDKRNTWIFIR